MRVAASCRDFFLRSNILLNDFEMRLEALSRDFFLRSNILLNDFEMRLEALSRRLSSILLSSILLSRLLETCFEMRRFADLLIMGVKRRLRLFVIFLQKLRCGPFAYMHVCKREPFVHSYELYPAHGPRGRGGDRDLRFLQKLRLGPLTYVQIDERSPLVQSLSWYPAQGPRGDRGIGLLYTIT